MLVNVLSLKDDDLKDDGDDLIKPGSGETNYTMVTTVTMYFICIVCIYIYKCSANAVLSGYCNILARYL